MPLYEYQCEECGETFELLVQSTAQSDEAICVKCGSSKTRRALSLIGNRQKKGKEPNRSSNCPTAST